MSSVQWKGNRIMQAVGGQTEELGYLQREVDRDVWVVWLKDTRGVFGGGAQYVRGDEYPSEKEARDPHSREKLFWIGLWELSRARPQIGDVTIAAIWHPGSP